MKDQIVVVLDSCDGCGKTEMGKALSKMLGIPYFKNEGEWDNFEKDNAYFKNVLHYADPYFLSYLGQSKASVILDRAFPSEWVYSKVFGRETDETQLKKSDEAYRALGTKIIIPFRTSYDKVVDEFKSINEDSLKKIHDGYMEFAKWTKCDVMTMNVDDEDLTRELFEIFKFIRS